MTFRSLRCNRIMAATLPKNEQQHSQAASMNFSGFAEGLKASASKAAQVAQNFKGLDEMAATDDYIHTQGFNTAKIRPPPQHQHQQQQQQQQQPYLMNANEIDQNDDTSTLSTHSSFALLDRQRAAAKQDSTHGARRAAGASAATATAKGNVVPLKVSVPAERRSRKPEDFMSDYEDDNSSSCSDGDGDDDDDPIFSAMRASAAQTAAQCDENTATDAESSLQERHLPKAHRFMVDLDAHVAAPEQDLPPVSFSAAAEPSTRDAIPAATPGPSWLLNLRIGKALDKTSNQQPQQQSAAAPLSRKKWHTPLAQDETEANVLVSSTAMLGDEERQQLAQLKQQQPNALVRLVSLFMQHPREAFIGFTLVVGFFAYFYSKNRSLEA